MDGIVRFLLLPLFCLLGAGLGYFLPVEWKPVLIARSAWPMSLLLLGAVAWAAAPSLRRVKWRGWLRRDGGILLAAALIVLLFSLGDHRTNKIVHDELVLQGSAIQLLQDNQYRIPQFSHNLLIEFDSVPGNPDKRPPLFSVLLSLLHRMLGYGPSNGFLLNGLLGVCLLYSIAKCSQLLLPGAGWLAGMALFATLPLLSQNITSQHMEVLYLTLITGLCWVSLRILQSGRTGEIPLAYLIATLIAFTRYEGLLFLMVPFFVHLHAGWGRGERPRLQHVYWVLPLAMVFVFCLVGYVFQNPSFWQLEDFGNKSPFSLVYWSTNIGALFDFMLSTDRSMSNSLILSVAGLASFPIALLLIGRSVAPIVKGADDPGHREAMLIGMMGLSCGLFLALIFSYHWGYVNSHVTARFMLFPCFVLLMSFLFCLRRHPMPVLSLCLLIIALIGYQTHFVDQGKTPFALVLLFGGVSAAVIHLLVRRRKPVPHAWVAGFVVLFLFSETIPAIAQRKYEFEAIPMKRAAVFHEWIRDRRHENAVFLSDSSLYGILARESSSSIARFKLDPDVLLNLLRERKFSSIYAMQMFSLRASGDIEVYEQWQIPEGLLYEEVVWRRINDTSGVRMIRILGWDPDAEVSDPAPAQSASADPEA